MADQPGLLDAILAATHLVVPDDIPQLLDDHGRSLGARHTVVYLVDLDQRWLVPLSEVAVPPAGPLSVDGTPAGDAYKQLEVQQSTRDSTTSWWVPLVDGTERLGAVRFDADDGRQLDIEKLRAFSGLTAELVVSKAAYGDFFELAKRPRALTVAAELLWQLLPPLTFGTEDLVITGGLIPTTDLGGDAFDYGVNSTTAEVAIFDAMGHGLHAGLLATTAVAAYRNARREQLHLAEAAARISGTIAEQFGPDRFVTGVLLSMDHQSGRVSWCNAGHPAPLLFRCGRVVETLGGTGMPFGVGPASDVFSLQLERGDRILLYTDGVTEARTDVGAFFGIDELVEMVTSSTADWPPPETMRRLVHAVEEHNHGPMRDDATLVLVEWRGGGSTELQV